MRLRKPVNEDRQINEFEGQFEDRSRPIYDVKVSFLMSYLPLTATEFDRLIGYRVIAVARSHDPESSASYVICNKYYDVDILDHGQP